ncbi:hypothetical protein GUJ93_ZPchr0014g47396 [Zizania palustris]|uniref:No apical meristem-associated C-terminal domain-containing protein n=1 Tax=Zizania palustris TaxID=103762 RepID=A0A8J5W0R7_ZIZPA|nr:hypothetical protein GUJ93_ZPchr0014g47396 [Zizania palustris]
MDQFWSQFSSQFNGEVNYRPTIDLTAIGTPLDVPVNVEQQNAQSGEAASMPGTGGKKKAKWNEWLAKEWNKGTKEKASPQDVTDGSTGASGQEGTEGSNIPTRPIGRDKAKRMRTCPAGSSSSSSAYIDVLQKIHEDRSKYDARVEAATIEEAQAIATRAERKLALQEKHVSIQEKQLEIATELLNLQKEDREDKVMSLDVEKMSPWVRDYYIRKQKEIAARAASGASSSDLS